MKMKTYIEGYYDGVTAALEKINNRLDDDTIESLRKELLK